MVAIVPILLILCFHPSVDISLYHFLGGGAHMEAFETGTNRHLNYYKVTDSLNQSKGFLNTSLLENRERSPIDGYDPYSQLTFSP